MRPLRLEVEGFTSFRQRQVVDLSDLDLFVITGPTGSGKSSLLDAMVLALYGQVPRANKSELRDLVTHGMAEARIRLDFSVEGREYVATRRLPRSGGSQQATIERRHPEEGELITEVESSGVRAVNDRIEEIVGLDYATFTRAVLLPQGEFAEFLRGDRRERRQILIRLLDLHRYKAVGQEARSRARDITTRVETLEERLEAEFGDADEDGLAARRQELETARQERQAAEALADVARERLDEAAEARRDAERIGRVRERLDADRQRIEALASDWEELEPGGRATGEAVEDAGRRLEAAQAGRRDAAAQLRDTVTATGDEATLERLSAARERRQEAGGEVSELRDKAARATERRGALEKRLREATAAVDARRGELEAAREASAEARSRLDEAEALLRRARERATADEELAAVVAEVEAATAELEEAEAEVATAASTVDQAASRSRHLRREHAAAALRQGLEPGDPCPVCGRPVGELDGPASPQETELRAAEEREAAARRELSEAEATVARVRERLRGARSRRERVASRVAELESTSKPEAAAAEMEAARGARETAAAAEKEARRALEEADSRRQRTEVELGEARSSLAALEQAVESASGRLEQAEATLAEAYPDGLPEDLEADLGARRARLRKAREAEQQAAAAVDEARQARDAARQEREEHRRREARLDAAIAEVRGRLAERRTVLDDLLTEAVPEPPERQEDDGRAAWMEAAAGWAGRLLASAADAAGAAEERGAACLEGARQLLRDREVEIADGADADAVRSAMERLLAEARRAEVQGEERLGEMERAVERRGQLVEEIGELAGRARRLQFLGKELQENRFIDFILRESMAHLAASASAELERISEGRYSLGAEEHSFVVVDHANADECRSVATLSGGETFLASLALALALAQGLTDIAGKAVAARLEAIFIDEGFGNLDPATLETVVDALERLRETERMVGVITHVPTLADRIPGGLDVEVRPRSSRVSRR